MNLGKHIGVVNFRPEPSILEQGSWAVEIILYYQNLRFKSQAVLIFYFPQNPQSEMVWRLPQHCMNFYISWLAQIHLSSQDDDSKLLTNFLACATMRRNKSANMEPELKVIKTEKLLSNDKKKNHSVNDEKVF